MTALNAQLAALSVALNPDGTLKNNSVSTAAIQDRAVTLSKLAFLSSFYAVDTGAANAAAISFAPLPLAAYGAGLVFFVKIIADNGGACTLNVDGLGPVGIKVYTSHGIFDPVGGNLKAGGVYIFTHDGVNFVLENPSPAPSIASPGPSFLAVPTLVYTGGASAWATFNAAGLMPVGHNNAILKVETSVDTSSADGSSEVRVFGRAQNGAIEMELATLVCRDDDDITLLHPFVVVPVSVAKTFDSKVTTAGPHPGTTIATMIGSMP